MEFVEVMRQRNRMCKKYWTARSCHGCPVAEEQQAYEGCCLTDLDPKRYEELVLQWATEHPEPVYPTFREWLISIGVIDQMSTHSVIADILAMTPIPADIAQKLGIAPKHS